MFVRIAIVMLATLSTVPPALSAQSLTEPPPPPVVDAGAADQPYQEPVLPEGFVRVGDMLLEPLERTNGVTVFAYRNAAPWAGGVLPILFDAAVTAQERQFFYGLCNSVWGGLANVRCVDRTAQPSWVQVSKANSGCFAAHGGPRAGMTGPRALNLAPNCWASHVVLHEIGHALGLMHEHQRPGRDQFIQIRMENVISGQEAQFAIINQGAGDFYTPYYDFGSLMHYPATMFSSNGQPTIVPKPEYASIAGNFGYATRPSGLDADILRAVYGAPATVSIPGAPTGFSAGVVGNRVTMSWGAPAAGGTPTSYVITAKTALGAILGSWDIGNVTSVWGDFAAGTYVLSVQAKNTAGTGAAATVQVTVGNVGVRPGAPANLVGTVQGTTLTLSWSAPVTPGQVQSYVLHYGFAPGFTTGHQIDLGTNTRVSFANVPAGTFYMRIVARNQYGTSTPSNEVRVVVGGASVPAAPSLLPIERRGGNLVHITWLPGAGAAPTSYLLDVAATPTGAPYTSFPLTGTSWTGTAPRGVYYLRVRALNAAGTSAPSETRMLTVQ
ncbi:MAG: M12 family metallopeptidase [Vicinamibacterales bacterium]